MDTNDTEVVAKAADSETKSGLYMTGGHNLIVNRPVFTNDSKYLLICSGNHLRRYVVDTGAYIASHYFGHQNDIICFQILDKNSDEVMVISSDGLVIIWNLSEDRKVIEFDVNIKPSVETMIWCQMVSNVLYFTTNISKKDNEMISQLYYCPKNLVQQKALMDRSNRVNPSINSVAFCPTSQPRYCVAIHDHILYLYAIPVKPGSLKKRHLIKDDKQFTCIASHPYDEVIATGDSLGRIIIWNNFVDNNNPARHVLHWHQLPVADLCLSPEGTTLYSVGAEMTLIRWDISGNNFGQNNFMPRLGMAIKYVTIDTNNHMIATSHEDNIIQILGPQMKGIKCVIEGMARSIENGLSTGLLWNPLLKTVVMNGRTGHLQFYSPSLQKQLFQLDVVQQNLISSSRDHKVFPIDITKAAVNEDGVWLSTVEMRDDFETLPEMRLKFWRLNKTHKNYYLNTTIHLPHKSDINCLKFSPNSQSMVTTSDDKEFKVWHLVEDDDKQWWKCFKVGNVNNASIPSLGNWSSDSSTLAIAYNTFVTLWDVLDFSVLKYMRKLSVEQKTDGNVISVDFGTEDKSHYLIESREYVVKVWNLKDLSLFWKHRTYEPILCSAFNRWENKLSVCLRQTITFFGLDSDISIGSVDLKPRDRTIIAALFSDEMPDNSVDKNLKPFLEKSKFYCINSRQELLVFGPNDRQFAKTEVMQWNTGDTLSPIALMLMNKQKQKDVSEDKDFENYFKTQTSVDQLIDDMFLNVPSHVLPSIDVLSLTFLRSLNTITNRCRQPKEDIEDKTEFKIPSDSETKPLIAINYDIQSDIHSNSTNLDTNDREIEVKGMTTETTDGQNNSSTDFIEEDYSWLKVLRNMK